MQIINSWDLFRCILFHDGILHAFILHILNFNYQIQASFPVTIKKTKQT
jgi:hypothetical protein